MCMYSEMWTIKYVTSKLLFYYLLYIDSIVANRIANIGDLWV